MKRFKITYIDYVHENTVDEARDTAFRDIIEYPEMFVDNVKVEEVSDYEA